MRYVILLMMSLLSIGCTNKSPEELIGKWTEADRKNDPSKIHFYNDNSLELIRFETLSNNHFFKRNDSTLKALNINDFSNINRNNVKYSTHGDKDSLALVLDFYSPSNNEIFYSYPLGIIRIQSDNELWLYPNYFYGDRRILDKINKDELLKFIKDEIEKYESTLPAIDFANIDNQINEFIRDKYQEEYTEYVEKSLTNSKEEEVFNKSLENLNEFPDYLNSSENYSLDESSLNRLTKALVEDHRVRIDLYLYLTRDSDRKYKPVSKHILNITLKRIYYIIKTSEQKFINAAFIRSYGVTLSVLNRFLDIKVSNYYHDYNNLNEIIFNNREDPEYIVYRKGF